MTSTMQDQAMPAPPAHLRIANDIRERIRTGALKPGEMLDSQQTMAAAWHCSLQPVKAALARLEIEGWIYSRQGVGAFVVDNPPNAPT